jgi:hypothetical protein
MKPFRNNGWAYYDRIQSILPNAGARGRHAFSATQSERPPLDDEGSEEGGKEEVSGAVASGGKGIEGMDVDGETIGERSASGSKRKLSALGVGADDSDTIASTGGQPLSIKTSSEPARKKISSKPSSSSAVASSLVSEKRSRRSTAAAKITPAVAISGMQGSINRLTDVFEKSLTTPQDTSSNERSQAIRLLQNRDEGLTQDEMVQMILLFTNKPTAPGTYLALERDDIRKAWMEKILSDEAGATM